MCFLDIRVSQVMYPVVVYPGSNQDLLEFLPDRWLGIMAAVGMSEHQTGEISLVPQVAHLAFLPLLIAFVLLQHVHDKGRRRDDPGLAVFQGAEHIPLALGSRLDKLLHDADHAVLEVHAVPGRSEERRVGKEC